MANSYLPLTAVFATFLPPLFDSKNLFNYFSVSGISKQKKISHQKTRGGGLGHFVVGTTQKYNFFYAVPKHRVNLPQ